VSFDAAGGSEEIDLGLDFDLDAPRQKYREER
jgi:hypothetical protein